MELVVPLHNDLFVQLGRDTFGSEEFNKIIDIYQKNERSPEAFSPDALERIYEMIMSKKEELSGIYIRVEGTARDMASILGWGYDPHILRAILSTRGEILSITRLMSLENHDLSVKRKVVENYLDIDGATNAWVDGLARKLGITIEKGR
jgi:hypothetical protein